MKGTGSLTVFFKSSAMFSVVFASRRSFPVANRRTLNKVGINRSCVEVNIIAFFGIGVIQGNLEENNNHLNY